MTNESRNLSRLQVVLIELFGWTMLWWSSELVDCLSFVFVCTYTPLQFLNFMNADVFVTVFHLMCLRDITALRADAYFIHRSDRLPRASRHRTMEVCSRVNHRAMSHLPVQQLMSFTYNLSHVQKSRRTSAVYGCNIFLLRYTCSSFGHVSTNV